MAAKSRLKLFFEIWRVRFWKMLELNFIFLMFCIPVITIPAAISGMTKVLKTYSEDKHAFVFMDFWDAFKSNFKQSFLLGLIDLFLIACLVMSYLVYSIYMRMEGGIFWTLAFCITVAVSYTFIVANYYAFLMIVSVELRIRDIIKNSLVMAVYASKTNLAVLVISIVTTGATVLLALIFPPAGVLLLMWPTAFNWYVMCYLCYPYVKKFILEPNAELYSEDDESESVSSEDNSEEILLDE